MSKMPKPGQGNVGGPMQILDTEAEVKASLARQRANDRWICNQIIEENSDPDAVAGAKTELAELDALDKLAR